MKKNPHKLSTEDLLSALENNDVDDTEVDEIHEFRNDVPLFMRTYGIEAGPHKVSQLQIYRLYLQNSESKVTKRDFGVAFCQFVESDRHNYFINKTRAEITTLTHARNYKNSKYNASRIGTRKHIEQFLSENNIKPGNRWVESFVLLYIYKKWCRANRKNIRFKQRNFSSILKLYLPTKRTTHLESWLRVDQSILDNLTETDRRKIKNDRQAHLEAFRKRKEEQKKRS